MHLANTHKVPSAHASTLQTRRRSSTSSLDGVAWSETGSERVAKLSRRSSDGIPLIPVALHREKLQEQTAALRMEAEMML
jgi:hypothetical protein